MGTHPHAQPNLLPASRYHGLLSLQETTNTDSEAPAGKGEGCSQTNVSQISAFLLITPKAPGLLSGGVQAAYWEEYGARRKLEEVGFIKISYPIKKVF